MRGRLAIVFAVWFSMRLLGQSPPANNDDVAIVVNEKNSVNELSMPDLRKILAGERHNWPGGQPVKLVVRAPGTHERLVLLRVLHMSESEYKQYWISQVFRGEAQAEPVVLPSNGMQKEALASFPGGIALVEARDVKTPMKVLKIDGYLPGQPGYPLH
ncbi:MAG TPA: substrate-binding domain-containing protein [Terriglobales bacterium]|nr:substrate-binding domain-containing protein [Terriglobales bacterium]